MTVSTISPAAVRKSIVVKAPPARAFEVFTSGMGRWWPGSHNTQASPITDVMIEPRVGGRWFSRHEDGGEADWGRVLAWEPPGRAVLGWQLNAEFQYDPDFITEVEITFTAQEAGTLVTLEHRNLERYGEAAERVRGMIDSDGGWGGLLQLFAAAAESSS